MAQAVRATLQTAPQAPVQAALQAAVPCAASSAREELPDEAPWAARAHEETQEESGARLVASTWSLNRSAALGGCLIHSFGRGLLYVWTGSRLLVGGLIYFWTGSGILWGGVWCPCG